MASLQQQQGDDSDDGMDEFMDKFKKEKYKNGFNESTWEEVRNVLFCMYEPMNSVC